MLSLYADLLFSVEKQEKKTLLTELREAGTNFCLCREQFYQRCRWYPNPRPTYAAALRTDLEGCAFLLKVREAIREPETPLRRHALDITYFPGSGRVEFDIVGRGFVTRNLSYVSTGQ